MRRRKHIVITLVDQLDSGDLRGHAREDTV
jgi:hypothetical protein